MAKTTTAGTDTDVPAQKTAQAGKSFDQFLNILKVNEQVPGRVDDRDLERLHDVFDVWKEQNYPMPPNLKELQDKVVIPERIYRRKYKGEQYISYVGSIAGKGLGEQVGMTTDIEYGVNGAGEPDYSIVTKRDRHPTIKYTKALAEKIIAKAKRYNDTVELRFVFLQSNKPIHNEDNFYGDFDEVWSKIMKGEMV